MTMKNVCQFTTAVRHHTRPPFCLQPFIVDIIIHQIHPFRRARRSRSRGARAGRKSPFLLTRDRRTQFLLTYEHKPGNRITCEQAPGQQRSAAAKRSLSGCVPGPCSVRHIACSHAIAKHRFYSYVIAEPGFCSHTNTNLKTRSHVNSRRARGLQGHVSPVYLVALSLNSRHSGMVTPLNHLHNPS